MSMDYSFKIISVGASGVGKTSLIRRFTENTFEDTYIETLGVDFAVKRIRLQKSNVELKLFDTAGQERFGALRPYYFRGAQGAIIVFDISRRRTFELIRNWLHEVYINCGMISFMLVGNKIDLADREIPTIEAKKHAETHNVPYIETSAKTGENVEQMYSSLVRQIMAR